MKRTKLPKHRKGAWFVAVRGSYLPVSWQGWLTYLPFTAYLVFAMIVGTQTTHAVGETILFVVPNWVAATIVMTWLAKRTS